MKQNIYRLNAVQFIARVMPKPENTSELVQLSSLKRQWNPLAFKVHPKLRVIKSRCNCQKANENTTPLLQLLAWIIPLVFVLVGFFSWLFCFVWGGGGICGFCLVVCFLSFILTLSANKPLDSVTPTWCCFSQTIGNSDEMFYQEQKLNTQGHIHQLWSVLL